MSELPATPGQTVGPFFHYGLSYRGDNELAPSGHPGAIRLHGTVFDGAGEPVPDALVEVWQPDSAGTVIDAEGSLHRDGWTFTGWGRAATDPTGHYSFTTVAPGGQIPYFALAVFARGLLDALFTRAYLPHANLSDDLLTRLEPHRRQTLICQAEDGGYHFDIHLQGASETVFLRHSRVRT